MKVKEMRKFIKHIEKNFHQECETVLHGVVDNDDVHIDVLYLGPTEEFPFNKLITMGESDFKLPEKNYRKIDRNEYMIFFDKDIKVSKEDSEWMFYLNALMNTAEFARTTNTFVCYGHDVYYEYEDSDMVSTLILFPEVMPDAKILVAKLGLTKKCMCYQVMPITKEEYDYDLKYGPIKLITDYFYKDDDLDKCLYLAQKIRKKVN